MYEEFDIKKIWIILGKNTNLDKKIQTTEPFKVIKTDEKRERNNSGINFGIIYNCPNVESRNARNK